MPKQVSGKRGFLEAIQSQRLDNGRWTTATFNVVVGSTCGRSSERFRRHVIPTALADLWKHLEHRFGKVDAAREAKWRFEARCQTDSETIVEYEQALRTCIVEHAIQAVVVIVTVLYNRQRTWLIIPELKVKKTHLGATKHCPEVRDVFTQASYK